MLLLFTHSARSEIKFVGETNVFYTSDVSIFSASQRLSLREDPTQPFLETTGVGDDVVYEPVLKAMKTLQPSWGKMKVQLRAQGYIFTSHTKFNHGTYGLQLTQELPADVNLLFRYHFGPDQYVGRNKNRRQIGIFGQQEHTQQEQSANSEEEHFDLASERVTTHFGTMELEREIFRNISLRALGRYGNRSYNKNFAHRNTDFWTIGTHLEWEPHPRFEFLIGYHYERGLADGRDNTELEDDVSYNNHYVSAEMKAHLSKKTVLTLGFDFDQSLYTTNHIDDERRNGSEKIYQGDVEVRHKLCKNMDLRIGYQRAQRKFTFEENTAIVNTFLIGSVLRF